MSRRWLPRLFLYAVVLLGGGLLWLRPLGSASLLDRASLIAPDTRGYFQWRSESRIEVVRNRKELQGDVFLRDLRTGKEVFSRPWKTPEAVEYLLGASKGRYSPDGRRLLYIGVGRGVERCVVRTLSDAGDTRWETQTWPREEDSLRKASFAWMPDSQGFAVLHRRFDSWYLQTYRLHEEKPVSDSPLPSLPQKSYEFFRLVGFTGRSEPVLARYTLVYWGEWGIEDLFVLQSDLSRPVRITHWQLPRAPTDPDHRPSQIAVAPGVNRIAWLVQCRRGPDRWERWLAPWLKRPAEPQWSEEIWTTRIDGTDWRCVGRIPHPEGDRDKGLGHELWWSPDGRQILFEHRDALRAVPAS